MSSETKYERVFSLFLFSFFWEVENKKKREHMIECLFDYLHVYFDLVMCKNLWKNTTEGLLVNKGNERLITLVIYSMYFEYTSSI